MTKYTPFNAFPVAEDTDPVKQYPANVDDPFKAMLDRKVLMTFTSATDRDAKIPTPEPGMRCFLEDLRQEQVYEEAFGTTSANWRPSGGVMPSAVFSYPGSALSPTAAGRIGIAPQLARVQGGMVKGPNNGILVPYIGIYQCTLYIDFNVNPVSYAGAMIGSVSAQVLMGTYGMIQPDVAFSGQIAAGPYEALINSMEICPWYRADAGIEMNGCAFYAHWLGSLKGY